MPRDDWRPEGVSSPLVPTRLVVLVPGFRLGHGGTQPAQQLTALGVDDGERVGQPGPRGPCAAPVAAPGPARRDSAGPMGRRRLERSELGSPSTEYGTRVPRVRLAHWAGPDRPYPACSQAGGLGVV